MAVILIGGGARSGKSRYSLEKARGIEGTRAFIATSQGIDEEWAARIHRHRQERDNEFATIEEPIELTRVIASAPCDIMIVDCLTLWLSNIMFANRNCDAEIGLLVKTAQEAAGMVIFVSNEVGMGIVPTDHALLREFRDRAGLLNQRIAAIAQEVYFIVFGQPLRVK